MTSTAEPRQSGQHLSDVDIAKILGLDKAGESQRPIAKHMKCSLKAVQNALNNYDFDTFQGRHSQREYKRKTTAREDRYIERIIKQNDSLPLRDITNIVNKKVIPQLRLGIGLVLHMSKNSKRSYILLSALRLNLGISMES